MTLDLRTGEGRDIALRLMGNADVVIQNFRPGVMDKRGLGYDDIKKINPKIVYCSISGFGPRGPYRDMPGYDTVGQASSGLLSLLTDPRKAAGHGDFVFRSPNRDVCLLRSFGRANEPHVDRRRTACGNITFACFGFFRE